MIPVLALVRWRRPGGRCHGVWLPLILIWLILLPFVLVLLPFAILILALVGAKPLGTVAALWNLLVALKGTEIDVDGPSGAFVIRIF